MHLASRLFTTLCLISFSTLALAREPQLSKIERSSCFLFPKMLEADKLVNAVHYKADHDSFSNCQEDPNGNIKYDTCSDSVSITFNYRYFITKTFDHYTGDGKLVTTTTENDSNEITEDAYADTEGEWGYKSSGDYPQDEAAKNQVKNLYADAKEAFEAKIAKELYETGTPSCVGSAY